MAASIGFYETDDTTPLTTLQLGGLPPGGDYYTRTGAYAEVRVKNDGTEAYSAVDVEIQQFSADAGYEHLRIAPDAGGGTPGAFQAAAANPLSLGALAVGEVAAIFLDVVVPGGAAVDVAHRSNVVLIATV